MNETFLKTRRPLRVRLKKVEPRLESVNSWAHGGFGRGLAAQISKTQNQFLACVKMHKVKGRPLNSLIGPICHLILLKDDFRNIFKEC